ncbi:hypothetical protein TVH25_00050 [Rhodococcus sp. 7Tela_A2]|uniref:hypothetical protein n=1 Tax=Rhodococcus sp. 7Tela_A2 TaxID=3093744 RepID=UPI003BB812B6
MSAVDTLTISGTRFERTLLARPGAAPDTTSRVVWLQGASLYCDLRRPAAEVPVQARSLGVTSIDDLLVLATQDGFAGRLLSHGGHVEWTRTVAVHPPGPHPDAGSLELLDATTVAEHGVFEDYLEHWRISATSSSIDEYLLEDIETGAPGILIRVGEDFAFARGRTRPIDGAPLHEQIRGAGTLSAARELMNCEISFGSTGLGEWRITASTLPFRVGDMLDPVPGEILSTSDIDVDGRPVMRRWRRLDLPETEQKGMA